MFRIMLFLATILFIPHSHATEISFSTQAFEELSKAGEPVLLFVHANWCPTCHRQETILSELFSQDEYKHITRLRIDFDKQPSVVKNFGVRYQSTLVLYNKGLEVDRSTADIDKVSIAELLDKVL
jgi:thioredoxin-like negative regulator of GroEL